MKIRKTFKANSWIDCVDLSEDEIKKISKKFKIDEGLLEDSRDIYEMPRLEKEDGIFSFFIRFPAPKSKFHNLATIPILISIHKDYILTSYGKLNKEPFFMESLRTEKSNDFTTEDKKAFLIKVLNLIDKKYERAFRKIGREVLERKSHISEITDKDIERFVELETIVNEYLSALIPMTEEMDKILKSDKFLYTNEEEWDDFEDILLAQKQLIDSGKGILKMIQNVRSAFSIIATNRLNRTITILTILTLVLTIPTIIGSFFGMNLRNGFENSNTAFYWIIALSIFTPILLFVWIKKKKFF